MGLTQTLRPVERLISMLIFVDVSTLVRFSKDLPRRSSAFLIEV